MRLSTFRPPSGPPIVRLILRRSDSDGQEGSIDVQRAGARRFADSLKRGTPPISWESVVEYVDDGVSGDDFTGRLALHRLMREVQAGDVVICRDNSRLGRDALDVGVVVRDLLCDRRARLFYYSNGREVSLKNAAETAMVVLEGMGAQAELEAIRSRTKEAMRERVRAGHVAGGRCYGYRLERKVDSNGRRRTIALIDEQQAEVVRWIFETSLKGLGLKAIAADLNRRGVPPTFAGRRGTGSWDPSAVRAMLRRERYVGVYVHGLTDRVKRGGKRVAQAADPSQVLRVPMPEWQIVDSPTWEAVQAALATRSSYTRAIGPHAKHPMAGLAKCANCGGSIGARNIRTAEGQARGYGCSFHARRGSYVCPVALTQPVEEVERALVEHMSSVVLTEDRIERIVEDVRAQIELEDTSPTNTAGLESELDTLRSEQKRYAIAIAKAPDVDELVSELQRRAQRIRAIEGELAASRRPPIERRELLARVTRMARGKLATLRESLAADRDGLLEVFRAFFAPGSLRFEPTTCLGRNVWKITGVAHLRPFTLESDPIGN